MKIAANVNDFHGVLHSKVKVLHGACGLTFCRGLTLKGGGESYFKSTGSTLRFWDTPGRTGIITSCVSGRGNVFGSVRLSVCSEPLDLRTQNLAHTLRTIISRTSLKVKGQGHQGQKCQHSSFQSSFRKGDPRSRSRGSRSQKPKVVGPGQRS